MSLTIAAVTFDCANARVLANFWADLLGMQVDPDPSPYFASIGRSTNSALTLMFTQVPDKTPGKNVLHLDLHTPDLAAEVARARSLGAQHKGDFNEYGVTWATLADPEGNLFDIGQD